MPENEIISLLNTYAAESRADMTSKSRQQLTNEDFRKLMMTPRGPSTSSMPTPSVSSLKVEKNPTKDNKHDLRKKKKNFYASLKKQEDDKMAELAEKYRDRARERREGGNPDYQSDDPISTMSGYRAVAPDAKSGLDAAERRRQLIQESKFLGGDMEHTHLVKGLDYALLQKVRSEITSKEKEEDDLDEVVNMSVKAEKVEEDTQIEFHSTFAKNIFKASLKNQHAEKNELFFPGRLAYVIELEDEFAESDIPTTLIRSKADCPSVESQTTLTTNDIVINKLTQILSYLRQGARANKKLKRRDKGSVVERVKDDRPVKISDESIYGDIGDYVPNTSKAGESSFDRRDKRKRREYFDKSNAEGHNYSSEWDNLDHSKMWGGSKPDLEGMTASALVQEATIGLPSLPRKDDGKSRSSKILTKLQEPDSYAECYPGAPETADAIDDSDDDVDYTKMDMGNKKGPVGRWDFDSQEEYSHYMNQKEALPKAAFQYGVKMADGRKTRRTAGKKDEKAELDREWQKISQIIAKRKNTEEDRGEPDYKVPRY